MNDINNILNIEVGKLGINDVIVLSKENTESAYKRLLRENALLAKRANTRLTALETEEFDYYAYDRATGFTSTEYGKNRFTTSKKILSDSDEVAQQLLEVKNFLSSKSSTIRGQRTILDKRLETFKEKGLELPKGKEKDFLRFLGSESIQDVFEETGRSEELVEILSKAYRTSKDIKPLLRQFDLYSKGELAYDELKDKINEQRKKRTKKGGK